jgi:hypothetical protein
VGRRGDARSAKADFVRGEGAVRAEGPFVAKARNRPAPDPSPHWKERAVFGMTPLKNKAWAETK